MPPQQAERLLNVLDGFFELGLHDGIHKWF